MRQRVLSVLCAVGLLLLVCSATASEGALKEEAAEAMRRATDFFRTQVSTEGGYLWRYSEDLSLREGEGTATDTMIWVQPPGTPSVGMVFLSAYEATGDSYYLDAARDAAYALVRGQLRSGGWDYRIEFDPERRRRYAYRVDPPREGQRNVSTMDDNNTQSAVRLLMRVDKALDFKDEKIHEAADFALSTILKVQYPNGAWPQRFTDAGDPAMFPVKKACYPDSWSWTFPARDYRSFYTFNDNSIADTIETMLEAFEIYGQEQYKEAAEKAGDFIILAQMPEPQPAWAQQYNAQMQPAWARKFEPPAITGGESQGIMRTLLTLYRATGKEKYLEPLPRAIEYLRRSRLDDGRLARFYELKTNKPLYLTRGDYKVTYSDADMPTHYSFKQACTVESIALEYERLRTTDPARLKPPKAPGDPGVSRALAARTRSMIDRLDEQGRWLQSGRMREDTQNDPVRRVIDCRTFISNVRTLSAYLAAAK
ncbi:MAG: pectate lyase [Planctomycetota bacterium]|jgi:PelA/Pel-15E family pectate lyase